MLENYIPLHQEWQIRTWILGNLKFNIESYKTQTTTLKTTKEWLKFQHSYLKHRPRFPIWLQESSMSGDERTAKV